VEAQALQSVFDFERSLAGLLEILSLDLKFSNHGDKNRESIFLSSSGASFRRPMKDFPQGAVVLSRKLRGNPGGMAKSSGKRIILLILPSFRRFNIMLYYTRLADFQEGK
jgi:hypothetical protein